MDPAVYIPAYLESAYAQAHPDLTAGARELLRTEVQQHPDKYAATEHARFLLAYARVHNDVISGLNRLEDLPDEEFERKRDQLFRTAHQELQGISNSDRLCIDAQLLGILVAEATLDERMNDLMQLERHTHSYLCQSVPGFDSDAPAFWNLSALEGRSAAEATVTNPEVIGWLHTLEVLAQDCLFTARYRAAAQYARTVMRAQGYPNLAIGTLLLALARLEDEDGFFEAARQGGEGTEDLPWFLLGRTLLLYKLGRRKHARRALRDFANRCEGGAFFLLNPTYMNPYLPVRPVPRESCELTHQAVWEADGIIMDTPDFAPWAASVEGIEGISEEFARRYGF